MEHASRRSSRGSRLVLGLLIVALTLLLIAARYSKHLHPAPAQPDGATDLSQPATDGSP